jgi:hypothetical protein
MVRDPRIFSDKFQSGSMDNKNALAYIDLHAQDTIKDKRLAEAKCKNPKASDQELEAQCDDVTPLEIYTEKEEVA